ncbi:MAG: response regulator [Gammaproteobacteria bacterium]|nr:response regulator [Gammaproteobacteria bacterium]MCW8986283.1 response regulator [Gammaproteobacteria bacterium]MCW9030585.1 response regulator [Gammaproteobacteria bacterium]
MKDKEHQNSILYIEDNPANLRLVEQILENIPNVHMWAASEPHIGIELAKEHLPDLILLDINLPGMDGYEVLKNLQNDKACRDIAVIAISANAMPKDILKGKEAGFDSYITKPLNVKELLQIVESKLK